MFDPEKVERYDLNLDVPTLILGSGVTPPHYRHALVAGVRANDYDQLLALYRDAVKYRDAVIYG